MKIRNLQFAKHTATLLKSSRVLAFLCVFLMSGSFTSNLNAAEQATERTTKPLLVFAASSLAPVLGELQQAFHSDTGVRVSFSFSSSSILARQISAGAPAQIFITADDKWRAWLQTKVKGELISIAIIENEIILAANTNLNIEQLGFGSKPEAFEKLINALDNKTIAIADPSTVPLGRYAAESLLALGLQDLFAPYIISSNSAQANLRFLTTGAVSLAIIYRSDLKQMENISQIFNFPTNSHKAIIYQAIALPEQENEDSAAFLNYLKSPKAITIFIRYGFKPNIEKPEGR
jgi:molybdate transport system substrate-binding protein